MGAGIWGRGLGGDCVVCGDWGGMGIGSMRGIGNFLWLRGGGLLLVFLENGEAPGRR